MVKHERLDSRQFLAKALSNCGQSTHISAKQCVNSAEQWEHVVEKDAKIAQIARWNVVQFELQVRLQQWMDSAQEVDGLLVEMTEKI